MMSHANDSSPTKVHGSRTRMKRQLFPRAPQVSVVTRTVYASSTAIKTSQPQPEDTPIPIGPIVGGIVGGMLIVLVAVGGWWWWGSRLRASKAKGAKARRAQHLATARAGHSKTESTETLKTNSSHSKAQASLSEKTEEKQPINAHDSVQKPSAILAQEKTTRPPFMHQTNSSASLASSKYAPSRPSPLALNVVTRAPSVATDDPPNVIVTAPAQSSSPPVLPPQSAALHRLSPLPPKVQVVPPSPPPPAHIIAARATDKNPRQSVQSVQSLQSVASEYSLDSPIGVAYGGDELERQQYTNPRDEWRASQDDIMSRMRAAARARG